MTDRRTVLSGLASAVVGAATALVAVAPPAASAAQPLVTCSYRLNAWAGGFSADVTITNRGPAINGWTVHWTFDTQTAITAVWTATITQNSSGVYATNLAWNAVIPTDRSTTFGWSAAAPTTHVPTDLAVNGRPC